MPFDADLVLVDGSADWTFANINTSAYGTPTSTTRNTGGFVVIDLGSARIGVAARGIAVVLCLSEAAAAAGDALTATVEQSATMAFTVPHELGKLQIAGATAGVIIGSEVPDTVVLRVTPTLRFLRLKASVTAGDDFGVVYALLSPYPFRVL